MLPGRLAPKYDSVRACQDRCTDSGTYYLTRIQGSAVEMAELPRSFFLSKGRGSQSSIVVRLRGSLSAGDETILGSPNRYKSFGPEISMRSLRLYTSLGRGGRKRSHQLL